MTPAYHISLTAAEKRAIAEIALVETQIQWIMRMTMQRLLGLSMETAQMTLNSISVSANVSTWLAVVLEKHPSEEAKLWASHASRLTQSLSTDRNNFVHSIWGHEPGGMGAPQVAFLFGHTKGAYTHLRVRNGFKIKSSTLVPLSRLSQARTEAFRLSWIFAHIDWLAQEGVGKSPWRRKLGKPPQRPPSVEQLRIAKAQKRQPQSSKE